MTILLQHTGVRLCARSGVAEEAKELEARELGGRKRKKEKKKKIPFITSLITKRHSQ